MRIFLIILIFFIQNFAHSKEIKWKKGGFNTTDTYIQEVYNGKSKKYNLTFLRTFPNKKNKNEKNWQCRDWTVEEYYNDNKYISKVYSLNDCLPCLDKGSGYLCSYPYFAMQFRSRLYDQIFMEKKDDGYNEFMDDGTIYAKLFINLSSRERIEIVKASIKKKDNTSAILFSSRIVKFNTKYRQIPSESSKPKLFDDEIIGLRFYHVFERLIENVNLAIEKKNKLKIREKDVKTLLTIDPSASKYKFQTRD